MEELRDRLPRTAALIADDFAAGQHRGVQIYISRGGEVIADAASGEAAPQVPMSPVTRVAWLSSGKPLTAMAVALLWQRGQLSLDETVARTIPEFGAHGKQPITIRHLLTHTAGIPNVETGYPESSWDDTIAAICAAPLAEGWVIGRTAGYHVSSSWFILGELIQRISQRPFDLFLREELFLPLGMEATVFALTPNNAVAGQVGWSWRRVGRELQPLDWHEPPRLTHANPGSSARGPIHELGRFYERLLAMLMGGKGPLTPQTIEAMTAPHRVGEFDRTFQHVLDFGLGFLVNSNRYGVETVPYSFGRHASPRAFGHGGAQSAMAFADPEHGLAVAWAFNSLIGEPRHHVRNREINSAIYEDLGFAREAG